LTVLAQTLAEIHVLAALERGVKSAELFEYKTANNKIAAAQPPGVATANRMSAQRAVGALHPIAIPGRNVESPRAAHLGGLHDIESGRDPGRCNLVIRVHERKEFAARNRGSLIPQFSHGLAWGR